VDTPILVILMGESYSHCR